MTQTETYDPFEAAMNAKAPSGVRTLFGEMQADVWPCCLVKGEGKIPFDPTQHKTEDRRTAIDLTFIPNRGQYNVDRKLIAESNEWAKIMLPSLKVLNTDLRGINGKFVQVQLVPTGRKYTDKNTGEEKEYTTFKFIAVYPDLEACQAAADAFFKANGADGAQPQAGSSAPAPAAAKGTLMTRDSAANFLKGFWNAANGDVNKFLTNIAANPALAEHFDRNSPEVVALVGQPAAA